MDGQLVLNEQNTVADDTQDACDPSIQGMIVSTLPVAQHPKTASNHDQSGYLKDQGIEIFISQIEAVKKLRVTKLIMLFHHLIMHENALHLLMM